MRITQDVELYFSMGESNRARSIAESDNPSYFFVLTEGSKAVARAAVFAHESCPRELRGRLPEREYRLFDVDVPDDDRGAAFIGEVLGRLSTEVAPYVDTLLNPEFNERVAETRAAFEAAGMELFQEKHGYHWDDPGEQIVVPDRLRFVDIDEFGDDEYLSLIGRTGEGTLDRNDVWYRNQTGSENWGKVFAAFLAVEDRNMWLVGGTPGGEPVGFIAVSDFGTDEPNEWDRPPAATIAMMGVLPEHRGNGYVDDLLLAGAAAARRNGFVSMVDTVDVLNAPMDAAMIRTGHRRDVRPWHVWHYRAQL
jgi:ribosomal protein S18 acetylase RimI-like enzyme